MAGTLHPDAVADSEAFLRMLRAHGVREYEGPFPLWGRPVRLVLKDLPPPASQQSVAVSDTGGSVLETKTIEAAPGVHVDADAFGHEGG